VDRRRIIPSDLSHSFPLLECGDKLSATHERNRSEDAKAAINESPWGRNAADMTRDKSKRNHSSAGNQTKRDDPFVAYRVGIRADEQNSEYKVGKNQPVRPICEEWILCICCGESMVHARNPGQQMGRFSDSSYRQGPENKQHPMQFGLQRKSRDSAEKQTSHKKDKPESNLSQRVMRQGLNFLSEGLLYRWTAHILGID
jgi:hypothetical protein